MSDFEFKFLGTRSFEHLSQALAVKYLAPGITIFGDGPDGGREATFRGKLNYPSEVSPWDGYLVLQAKFLQIPKGDSNDVNWLCSQLTEELSKFLDKDRDLKRPEYYIIVTNVKLSSFQGRKSKKGKSVKNGKEKVEEVFEKFKSEVGLKDFDIWDYDKLRVYLENSPEIRTCYDAWLTPSDAIYELMQRSRGYRADFEEAMFRHLSGDLRRNQNSKLQQAGHDGEGGVSLSSVFIDLPVLNPDMNGFDDADCCAAKFLLDLSDDKYDPKTIYQRKQLERSSGNEDPDPGNRYLILGGPGQGKSTITQFISQVLRVRWLRGQPEYRFPEGVYPIIKRVSECSMREGISVDGVARFPVRIDLPVFADVIKESRDGVSLLEHIAHLLSDSAKSKIDIEDVRLWFKSQPWFVMLDGLDEVPASSNRAAVLERIEDFWTEVASAGADVVMVVTSRPQGYNDDLNPKHYNTIKLAQLNSQQALRLAKLLATALVEDASECDRIMETMRGAADNPTTSRLLVSPLQVAIMLKLVESRGEAPSDKWQLFNGYYQVISNREKLKNDNVSKIIKERGLAIDLIHQAAGLVLQVESERTGGSEAFLKRARFGELVEGYFQSQGQSIEDAKRLSSSIIEASVQRLVFLNGKIEEQVTFDVRSLQEYMAAACLMSGNPIHIQDRLRSIADKSHWQHVFQIAASKAFSVSDMQHIRDTVINICCELNDKDCGGRDPILQGSKLALILLEDGVAFDQPNFMRLLAKTALEGLRLGPLFVTRSLCDIACRADLRSVVVEALISEFARSDTLGSHAAWTLLAQLVNRSAEWAIEIAYAQWPANRGDRLAIIASADPTNWESGLLDLLTDSIVNSDLDDLRAIFYTPSREDKNRFLGIFSMYPYLERFGSQPGNGGERFKVFDRASPFSAEYVCISTSTFRPKGLDISYPDAGSFHALVQFDDFAKEPSVASLAAAFRALSSLDENGLRRIVAYAPWPVLAVLDQRSGRIPGESDLADINFGVLAAVQATLAGGGG